MIFLLVLLPACATSKLGQAKRDRLAGKVFVVTGASSGLGRGIALEAGSCRAKVVLASRNKKELEKVAAQIEAQGAEALVIPTDVTREEDVKALAEAVVRRFGRIDVWVNNAGVAVLGLFWKTPLADQLRTIDVNLKGVMYGSYYALNQFERQRSGMLINIASVESEVPTAYQVAYAASKAGVRTIGNTVRQELRLSGLKNIKVTTIEPYALDTPLWDHAAVYTGHAPRMALMDPPQKAVNAVMRACFRNKREIPVGWKARAAIVAHRISPGWVERIGSNMAHKYQADITPEVAPTSGNLFETKPSPGVEGGIRERMKEEKKQRKQQKKP